MLKPVAIAAAFAFSLASQAGVRDTLKVNAEAKSYEEWLMSGKTPHELLDSVKTDAERKALCRELGELPDADLALFEDAIDETEALECRDELLWRLKQHWEKSRLSMARKTLLATRSDTLATGSTFGRFKLPSVEKRIDVKATPSLLRADLPEGQIALTFDDGPHDSRTLRLLDILEKAGVRATFFDTGRMASKYPEIARETAERGHTVGSHSYSHPNLRKLSLAEARHQITAGRDAVALGAGVKVPFFRFPFGAKNPRLQSVVESEDMASFYWNMDTLDWKLRSPAKVLKSALSELDRHKGGIILFHDIQEQTIQAMPRFLEELHERGYTTVVFVPH